MNYEDEVAIAIAKKLTIRTKKRVNELTHNHSCQCRENLIRTIHVLVKFGMEVFNYRPEYYAAIIILADSIKEMLTELDKTKNDKVIYL